jgi:hypothetical protein
VVQDFIASIVKLHHQRKYLKPKAFVVLRALGGSGFPRFHRETAPLKEISAAKSLRGPSCPWWFKIFIASIVKPHH